MLDRPLLSCDWPGVSHPLSPHLPSSYHRSRILWGEEAKLVESGLLHGILDYTAFALLLLAVAHFVSRQLNEDLHKLTCYIIGTLLISGVYGVWCLRLTVPVSGSWAFVAYAAIVMGAGAGTLLGWSVDWLADKIGEYRATKRENRLLRAQVGDDDTHNGN